MKRNLRRFFVQIMMLSFAVILSLLSFQKFEALERKKIYEETEAKDVLIGLWSPPAPQVIQDQASMDQQCKEMYDLGARMVITLEEQWNMEHLNRLLDGAHRNDMKVLVYTYGDMSMVRSVVQQTKSHPAVLGYYLQDEPMPEDFSWLNSRFSRVKNLVPDNFLLVGNLLPDYGIFSEGIGTYTEYVSEFYDTVTDANAVFFDSYNFYPSGVKLDSLLYTIATNRTAANEKNVAMYPIMQAMGAGPYKVPSVEELRLQANLSLLFGSAGFVWYYYWVPYDMEEYHYQYAMVTYEGKKTSQWYAVQTVNQEIHNMKGVFLDYDFQGIISYNYDSIGSPFRKVDYEFTKYKELRESQGDGTVLVGCFDKDGKTGLYITNISTKGDSSVVLQLDGVHDYQIWNREGLAVLDKNSEIPLEFGYGEGCFIIID